MNLGGRKVLVTGGTGFIGGRLVEKLVLECDAQVRVLVRNFAHAARIARFPIEMVGGDITDEVAVQKAVLGCDTIFHCAHDFAGTRHQQKRMAVQGIRNVSEAVLQEGVPRMIHVSTFSVYGPTADGDLTESSPWRRPGDLYTQTKRAAERLVLDLHRREDLPVVVLQPTIVYGPFSKSWTIAVVNDLKTGLVPLVNGGDGYCNAVYVDDVVDAMILAATQPDVLGETFLISGEQPVTWKEFYSAFEAAAGIRATVAMSEEELRKASREQARLSNVIFELLTLVRQPEVVSRFVMLPAMRGFLDILRDHLEEERWESLKSRVLGNASWDHRQTSGSIKQIHVPNATRLALYQSKTRVRIDKARKRLGYVPQFDFEHGMELTTRFIRWANLA